MKYWSSESFNSVFLHINQYIWGRQKDIWQGVRKLWRIFQVQKNIFIKRAQFNSRHQQEDETSEQYITALLYKVLMYWSWGKYSQLLCLQLNSWTHSETAFLDTIGSVLIWDFIQARHRSRGYSSIRRHSLSSRKAHPSCKFARQWAL